MVDLEVVPAQVVLVILALVHEFHEVVQPTRGEEKAQFAVVSGKFSKVEALVASHCQSKVADELRYSNAEEAAKSGRNHGLVESLQQQEMELLHVHSQLLCGPVPNRSFFTPWCICGISNFLDLVFCFFLVEFGFPEAHKRESM